MDIVRKQGGVGVSVVVVSKAQGVLVHGTG
jgi:hypothetical protein